MRHPAAPRANVPTVRYLGDRNYAVGQLRQESDEGAQARNFKGSCSDSETRMGVSMYVVQLGEYGQTSTGLTEKPCFQFRAARIFYRPRIEHDKRFSDVLDNRVRRFFRLNHVWIEFGDCQNIGYVTVWGLEWIPE
jgi:hypothetical protein